MNAELEKLLADWKVKLASMSEEEIEAMRVEQRKSWVRAEMSWPEPKFKMVNGVKVYESYEDYLNG